MNKEFIRDAPGGTLWGRAFQTREDAKARGECVLAAPWQRSKWNHRPRRSAIESELQKILSIPMPLLPLLTQLELQGLHLRTAMRGLLHNSPASLKVMVPCFTRQALKRCKSRLRALTKLLAARFRVDAQV